MEFINLFESFKENEYKEDEIWEIQSTAFKAFWQNKIINKAVKNISENELDEIIRYLDRNAKGNTSENVAVAKTFIRMGMWYRVFKSLKDDENLQKKFDEILKVDNDIALLKLIDELDEINKKNKNGLTGKNGVIINAILFLNNPNYFFSAVSLAHRKRIIQHFRFGNLDDYTTFGEKIVYSNRLILDGFKNLKLVGTPRAIACFVYQKIKEVWYPAEDDTGEIINTPISQSIENINDHIFTIEKYFEDFLIGNWESTELGKMYELIEENDEIISQQYKTDIGRIDILVKEKNTGNFVVIELKRGQTSDDTVGQLARYMGWVSEKLSKNGLVKGIIIAHDTDEKLRYALKAVPNTEYYNYKINFSLNKI